MTTTLDSRIARDWGAGLDAAESDALRNGDVHLHDPLGDYAKRNSAQPIDTSTTAGKIAVMQAHELGEKIECKLRNGALIGWFSADAGELVWDWKNVDYRIAPPVAARSALQAASECRAGMTVVNVASPDGRLRALLREIDKAHTITAYPSDFGTTEFKFAAGAVPPGRYRLVRDDD